MPRWASSITSQKLPGARSIVLAIASQIVFWRLSPLIVSCFPWPTFCVFRK
jgi:hypothetical protein